MWYDLNYNILSVQLLPTFLRKQRILAFLQVLVLPINKLYYQWFVFRKDNLYKLAHTGQVCYLRKVLNDRFDFVNRGIRIGDGQQYERLYIYTNAELNPKYLGKLFLHTRSDYADTGVDFIVYVPIELDIDNYALKALINYYKEGVKRYKIIKE